MVSWRHARKATGLEHLAAQGYHVFRRTGTTSDLSGLLRTLDDVQLKQLSGNGWCLPAMCAWYLYVLSDVTRRRIEHVQPSLSVSLQEQASWEEFPPDSDGESSHSSLCVTGNGGHAGGEVMSNVENGACDDDSKFQVCAAEL